MKLELSRALDNLVALQGRSGPNVGPDLSPGLEPHEVRRILVAADMPVISEYVDLHVWRDGDLGEPYLFGDHNYSRLDESIELTRSFRGVSQFDAAWRGEIWQREWIVLGVGDQLICVLDGSTNPPSVLYAYRHGEAGNRTVAADLTVYVGETLDRVARRREFVWPSLDPAPFLAQPGQSPRWYLEGAFPPSIELLIDGVASGPPNFKTGPATLHRCRPRRRMRLAESVRLATWSTRRPFAFLESVDVSDAGVGDRQTARFILTGRGDEPIVGAPVRIVVSGAAEADALVLTDSRGLAELSYLADQVGDVIVRAVATVDGAHVYNSEMAVTGHVVDSPLAFWSRVWLDREPETNRVRVYAESLAEEPSSWVIRYRTSPGHWLSVSGQGRSSDGLLATIDEREVWPGTCPVVVTAENPGRQTSQLVWFDASRGRLAGLLADADPPVERDGESWSELVLTFDGRAYMVFGTLPGSDLSGGIVDASVVRWLAYGRPPEDKP